MTLLFVFMWSILWKQILSRQAKTFYILVTISPGVPAQFHQFLMSEDV